MVVGLIGFALFVYGKRRSRVPQFVAGIALMTFPMLTPNPWVMTGIAAAILALTWFVSSIGL